MRDKMKRELWLVTVLLLLSLTIVSGRGGGAVRDGDLDNYEWWSSGDIPTYIWVIAAIITVISVIFGIWTECCPNCVCAAKIKSYIVPSNAADATQVSDESNRNLVQSTKMLPISDDEFVVTFTD